MRKLAPKNHGLEVKEKQEKQKQNIDLSMSTNDNILKTMIKYNIPKVYSEIIDIYPKDCIYILHKRPPYIKKKSVKTLIKFSSFFKRYL